MSEFNVKEFLGMAKNPVFDVKAFLKKGKQIASELYQDYSFDTPQQKEDYKTIVKFWKDKGYNNYAVAGIVGNLDHESGNTFDYKMKQDDGGPGRGIAQMETGYNKDGTPKMRLRYESWLKTNKQEDSLLGQLNYIHGAIEDSLGFNELGSGNAKKLREGLKNVQSVKEATTLMQNIFFKPGKPNLERRIELSNRAYKELNGNK
ncbi:hypothetical protein MEP402_gp31 [Methylophilales phage MEP402]|nr:hypothetical protein MEP402_gp31 [Methylophilales phage MEP402]